MTSPGCKPWPIATPVTTLGEYITSDPAIALEEVTGIPRMEADTHPSSYSQ